MSTTTVDWSAGRTISARNQRQAHPHARHSRPGVAATQPRNTTKLELLTIAILIAIGSLFMTRALLPAQEWRSRQAAIDDTGRYIYKTRAIALRSARNTWLVRDGSVLTVYIDSAGTATPIGKSIDLREQYGVSLDATRDTLAFDPRGFVRSPAPIFVVSSKHAKDVVCVPGARDVDPSDCR